MCARQNINRREPPYFPVGTGTADISSRAEGAKLDRRNQDEPTYNTKNMNAIVPKRSLNQAFKRFQRLPELPVTAISDDRTMQSFGEARPLNDDATQSRGVEVERFTKVLSGCIWFPPPRSTAKLFGVDA